jgi:hypothetical protein
MLNHYDLGWYVGWFEIPRDFIGLPELYGHKCENLITSVIVFCTCALIIWTVLLHNATPISSPASPGNETLETLGLKLEPTLPTGKRPANSATSLCPAGHRRRKRPPAPPAATESPFFHPRNCGWGKSLREERRSLQNNGLLKEDRIQVCLSLPRT